MGVYVDKIKIFRHVMFCDILFQNMLRCEAIRMCFCRPVIIDSMVLSVTEVIFDESTPSAEKWLASFGKHRGVAIRILDVSR